MRYTTFIAGVGGGKGVGGYKFTILKVPVRVQLSVKLGKYSLENQ